MKSKVSSEESTGELNDTDEGRVRQDGNSVGNSFREKYKGFEGAPSLSRVFCETGTGVLT